MKRHCRDIKKVIWIKWRLLTFTKGVTRRSHSLKKHHSNQMDLKKHQSHLNIYIDNLSEEEQKSKKNDGKKTATKSEKKLKCLTVEKSTKVTSIY